jgi:hypothetical protein
LLFFFADPVTLRESAGISELLSGLVIIIVSLVTVVVAHSAVTVTAATPSRLSFSASITVTFIFHSLVKERPFENVIVP